MFRLSILATPVIFLLACAAQQPATDGIDATIPAAADTDSPTEPGDPVAETVAAEPGIVMPAEGTQIVCMRERRTGSNRVTKRCRSRAEIEADRVQSKETFESMRQSQEHIEQ